MLLTMHVVCQKYARLLKNTSSVNSDLKWAQWTSFITYISETFLVNWYCLSTSGLAERIQKDTSLDIPNPLAYHVVIVSGTRTENRRLPSDERRSLAHNHVSGNSVRGRTVFDPPTLPAPPDPPGPMGPARSPTSIATATGRGGSHGRTSITKK